jgi:hypothetical protein
MSSGGEVPARSGPDVVRLMLNRPKNVHVQSFQNAMLEVKADQLPEDIHEAAE